MNATIETLRTILKDVGVGGADLSDTNTRARIAAVLCECIDALVEHDAAMTEFLSDLRDTLAQSGEDIAEAQDRIDEASDANADSVRILNRYEDDRDAAEAEDDDVPDEKEEQP